MKPLMQNAAPQDARNFNHIAIFSPESYRHCSLSNMKKSHLRVGCIRITYIDMSHSIAECYYAKGHRASSTYFWSIVWAWEPAISIRNKRSWKVFHNLLYNALMWCEVVVIFRPRISSKTRSELDGIQAKHVIVTCLQFYIQSSSLSSQVILPIYTLISIRSSNRISISHRQLTHTPIHIFYLYFEFSAGFGGIE